MIGTLDTGIKNIRNVGRLIFGMGAIACLEELLSPYRVKANSRMVFLVDEFFETRREYLGDIPCRNQDKLVFVSTREEPTTEVIDKLLQELKAGSEEEITGIVGIGGGITLDTAKAISNLLHAERGEVTKGSIEYMGGRVDRLSPNDLVRRGVIQVMEGRHCFEHLSVEENLMTGAFTRRDGRGSVAASLASMGRPMSMK